MTREPASSLPFTVQTLPYGRSMVSRFPTIAAESLAPGDDLILMELHPAEHTQLKGALDSDPRAHVHHRDGFQALSR